MRDALTRVAPALGGIGCAILAAGRSRRLPNRAQRRALRLRDRGCIWPGCTTPPGWCEAHHLRPWYDHGPTDLANLALLCPFHHHLVHDQGWIVTRLASGWDFQRPRGPTARAA
jgi:hypothetical protein